MMSELDPLVALACRQLWQVTVVAALAAAIMRWFCRGRPQLAYLLGLVVLIKCWMPPTWSSQGGIFCWPPIPTAATHNPARGDKLPPGAEHERTPMATAVARERPSDIGDDAPAISPAAPIEPLHAGISSASAAVVCALTVWLLGVVGGVLMAGAQWWRWRRGFRRAALPPGNRLDIVLEDVAAQIGLRRVPRVAVTTFTGPAVFGLLRPTIVLPERLLADEAAASLEMTLAHEMIHIRRGDLHVGLLQFVTQLVWWFHPMVWWVCRRLTHERERACDEAVLAALRCPPARYAQCLLDVLRLKRQPMLPAFPGMGAIDVTRQRMEHIMRLRGICRGRTPLAHWLLASVALLVVLPGARRTVAISEETRPARAAEAPAPPAPSDSKPPAPPPATEADNPASRRKAVLNRVRLQPGDVPTPAERREGKLAGQKLEEAIDRGISFLKAEQTANGHWADPVGYRGGITSLCALTLLKWGMKPDERAAEVALAYLRKIEPSMTYSTSLQTLVFCAAEVPSDRKIIERNVEWLASQQKLNGPLAGAWGYPQAEGDNSNTGFAVWALYEADQAGVKAGNALWRRTLDHWLGVQNRNGSWGYKPNLGGTGSMTSQGIYCVSAAAKLLGEDKPEQPAAKATERATAWLARNFSAHANPGSHGRQGWLFYYLLACGKAATISDQAKLGDHDWFVEGSQALLDMQREDGSWRGAGHAEDDTHLATGLAVLFLLQGRSL